MKVSQISSILNTIAEETLGESALVAEDLSNIVDVGKKIIDSDTALENYTKKLIDHIGKVIFVDRPYAGSAPSVLMDGWQYGSILEKITCDIPDDQNNESWALENGTTYNQDTFTSPDVSAKFFNSKVTFEVPMSFARMQVESAFDSAEQVNSFFSFIESRIRDKQTLDLDALIMRTINNMIASTLIAEIGAKNLTKTDTQGRSGAKAVNLLYLYNKKFTKTLTTAQAVTDMDFLKFASMTIMAYSDRLVSMSRMFNIGEMARHTEKSLQHLVLLNDFKRGVDFYLQSDTFNDEYTKLPGSEGVNFWQGTGQSYAFEDISSLNVTSLNPSNPSQKFSVQAEGILGVLFDRDALGVCNKNQRTTTHYNARAEFVNNWYKSDGMYFNDYNENFIVFYASAAAGA